MPDKLDGTLKQLASISHSLNEASDLLSKRIAEVESALREYKLGVEAWIDLVREEEEQIAGDGKRYIVTRVHQVGYGKQNGKWGLLVAEWYDEFFDPSDVRASFLRDAPRDIRLAAVDKLPDLLKALAEKAGQVSGDAVKKAEQARQIAAGLSKKARPTP